MNIGQNIMRLAKGVFVIALVAALAACARTPGGSPGGLGTGQSEPGTTREFLGTVGDRVFFSTDSSVLTADARATLDRQAAWLGRYGDYKVLIEGHADERGTREYNIALGARRGSAVVNYLVSRGVSANRFTTKSFGKERPVAVCDDISCWSQNRRAVTVLLPK